METKKNVKNIILNIHNLFKKNVFLCILHNENRSEQKKQNIYN
jgi:hypothetical protein